MTSVLPHPVLTASLLLMWLLLNGFSAGHLVLGTAVALVASRIMQALHPAKPRLRRWQLVPRLFVVVVADVVRSNLAVSGIILQGRSRRRLFRRNCLCHRLLPLRFNCLCLLVGIAGGDKQIIAQAIQITDDPRRNRGFAGTRKIHHAPLRPPANTPGHVQYRPAPAAGRKNKILQRWQARLKMVNRLF